MFDEIGTLRRPPDKCYPLPEQSCRNGKAAYKFPAGDPYRRSWVVLHGTRLEKETPGLFLLQDQGVYAVEGKLVGGGDPPGTGTHYQHLFIHGHCGRSITAEPQTGLANPWDMFSVVAL